MTEEQKAWNNWLKRFDRKHKFLCLVSRKYSFFWDVLEYLDKSLEFPQKEILTLHFSDYSFDVKQQILFRVHNDKWITNFITISDKYLLFDYVDDILKRNEFLFNSHFDPQYIRETFISEMVSALTVDANTAWATSFVWFKHLSIFWGYRKWRRAVRFFEQIDNYYSYIPTTDVFLNKFWIIKVSFSKGQLPFVFHKLIRGRKFSNPKKSKEIFNKLLLRINWLLNELIRCPEAHKRKRQGEIIKEIRYFLWSDLNISIKRKKTPKTYHFYR